MKSIVHTSIVFMMMAALSNLSQGAAVDTIRFESTKLIIDNSTKEIRFSGLDQITDPNRPALPVRRCSYYLPTADAGKFTTRVLTADTLAIEFIPALSKPDQTTSSENEACVQADIIVDGSAGVYPSGAATDAVQQIDGAQLWTILVFPIQFLPDGRMIFNREIEIRYDGGTSAAVPIKGYPPFRNSENFGGVFSKSTAAGGGVGTPLGNKLVIVTSPALMDSFSGLLELKRRTGFDAAVAITDSIFQRYSGVDNAERLRNYLIDFYQFGGRYVILGGDESQVPIRYAHNYNVSSPPDLYNSIICDLYFADVDGNWDADGDGVWGEPTEDSPDLGADLAVGRLPFSRPEQVLAYTSKLEAYLFHPGNGDATYLNRTIFFTSDQMRDYFSGGQQYEVAKNIPENFPADLESLAESPTGSDPAPVSPSNSQAISDLSAGYGLVNILAHGRPDGFIIRSSDYNENPKTYLLTGLDKTDSSAFDCLSRNNKISFYYSIACEQGAIDLESLYNMPVPSVAERLLSLDSAGAIGLIAFTRWGWVGSSYKLMASFYAHLFGDADGYPIEAMKLSKADYSYYRDQIYGQNYFGDPTIRVYRQTPSQAVITMPASYVPGHSFDIHVSLAGSPLVSTPVVITYGDEAATIITDGNGVAAFVPPTDSIGSLYITAYVPGELSATRELSPTIVADAGDQGNSQPRAFALRQNYPNPFNPTTTISFTTARAGQINLQIYNILGQCVAHLVDGWLAAGEHAVSWNGTGTDGAPVSSGIYLYRVVTPEGSACRRMALVK